MRLSQDWVMRYPLIDGHGNFGNVGGDGPAAMRYTEARLSKIAEDGLLNGLKKRNVDFKPNYDETTEEPVTLPAIFPNLLCNPNSGIGVALACEWLPHNLKEVTQAIVDYMEDKEPHIPGPDFPTGGIIINGNDMDSIIKKGRGSVKIRGKYKTEKRSLVFFEIPYGVKTEALLTQIGEVCDAGEIPEITNVRDESNKKGLRIVIECLKDTNLDAVANKLYAKTDLQTSISYNQVALIDKTPTELGLIECIQIYIQHNIECLIKELNYDLKKASDRLHIVEGLLIALEDIDNVISLIKKSNNSEAAKLALIEKYNLSDVQAKAILAMRLSSLAKLEKLELEQEKKELLDTIAKIKEILGDKSLQKNEIKQRLLSFTEKYGDARRTEICNIVVPKAEKEVELVTPEDCVVVITKTGMINRVPKSSFKVQKRNGKGVKTKSECILDTISTNTVDNLLIFTNKGKMYKLLVDNIPSGKNTSKGVSILSLVKMDSDEEVAAVTSLDRKTNAEFVLFITKKGMVKKTLLSEYTKVKKTNGIIAINLKDGDSISEVTFVNEEELLLLTKEGMSIRFTTKDINPIGRVAAGVKGIKMNDTDEIVAALPVHKLDDMVAIITAKGFGKKVKLEDFTCQGRGGKGLMISSKDSNDEIVGGEMVDDNDNLLLSGSPNSICVSVADLPCVSRTSLGNAMVKNSKIISVTKI